MVWARLAALAAIERLYVSPIIDDVASSTAVVDDLLDLRPVAPGGIGGY
jgi:hypothetical protein